MSYKVHIPTNLNYITLNYLHGHFSKQQHKEG